MDKKYFYKDEKTGQIEKLVYCSKCRTGPFKKEEENIKFAILTRMCFCIPCTKMLGLTIAQQDIESKQFIELPKIEQKDQKDWYVYSIKCKDNTYYCGITQDLDKCVKKHNQGQMCDATKSQNKRPVMVISYELVKGKTTAEMKKNELKRTYNALNNKVNESMDL